VAFPAPFPQTRLELALGGTDKLVELAKAPGLSDPLVAAFVAEVQSAAAADVFSILQVVWNPADPTFQGSDFVQQNAVTCGIYWAWHKSTGGIAVPTDIKEARAEALQNLKDARQGLLGLGSDTEPSASYDAYQQRSHRHGWTRRGWGGFC
jgi:hypothetical protein